MSDKHTPVLFIKPSPSGTECWLMAGDDERLNGEHCLANFSDKYKYIAESIVRRCRAYPELVGMVKELNESIKWEFGQPDEKAIELLTKLGEI